MDVPVRELKNRLSAYLRRVARGEEVTVTSRGRPVARLAPLPCTPTDRAQALRDRLAAIPWILPGTGGKPRGSSKGVRLRGRGPTAAEFVLRDRE